MRGLWFRDAEHYFAKATIVAAEGLPVNKVIPDGSWACSPGLSPS